MRDPAARGQCGPLPWPAAFVVFATPCGGPTPPTSRPVAVVRMRTKVYRGFPALSTWECGSDLEMRVLRLEHLAVAREHRLGHGHQPERRLDVAAGLDPPARDGHRDVLLALEVLVCRLGGH